MLIDPLTLFAFSLAVVLLALTPGPDLFLIVGRGLSQGRSAAAYTALGFFLAGAVQVPLLALGLATVVANNPLAFDVIRYAGGVYLIWRGLSMLFGTVFGPSEGSRPVSPVIAMREGFTASLVNPKSHVFMLAFLPQFVDPEAGSVGLQFLIFGLVMRAVALLVEMGLAASSGAIGALLRKSHRIRIMLERAAGFLIVAVGVRLLLLESPAELQSDGK
ncbi:threonine transporter RhtB [Tateyamaria omphalii]|uniref:LysE family translocator n=1 Tax=Tateyamaria omphalii TaxID=299262 RepID=UPI0016722253|nr:LysE family translocator [Tateyamaria omphalii]GGX51761.1 threonine transporter RhtB [Tateyamaria omphalii]